MVTFVAAAIALPAQITALDLATLDPVLTEPPTDLPQSYRKSVVRNLLQSAAERATLRRRLSELCLSSPPPAPAASSSAAPPPAPPPDTPPIVPAGKNSGEAPAVASPSPPLSVGTPPPAPKGKPPKDDNTPTSTGVEEPTGPVAGGCLPKQAPVLLLDDDDSQAVCAGWSCVRRDGTCCTCGVEEGT